MTKGNNIDRLLSAKPDAYVGIGASEAKKVLASALGSVKGATEAIGGRQRHIGRIINAVAVSALASAAAVTEDAPLDITEDGRTTAVSAFIKSAGITADQAAAWRKYATGEEAREAAGIKKAAAVSAYRDVDADASVADITSMLSTMVADAGEDAPKLTRKNVGTAAAAAGIGTDAAGESANGGTAPAPEAELQLTPAQERTAAVNVIKSLADDGVTLTLTECKILESLIKEARGIKAAA